MTTPLMTASPSRVAQSLSQGPPQMLVAGSWRTPTGDLTEEQFDPSTGETTGTMVYSSIADVDAAVEAARRAQPALAALPLRERLERLAVLRRSLADARGRLVELVTAESAKTMRETEEELDLADRYLAWLADPANWPSPDSDSGVEPRPLGVAAGISLYHYPVLSMLWMAAPALAAGNGYVLRPCTWSPVTGEAVGRAIESAFPDGEFEMLHGGIDVVDRLLVHPDVSAVSYVGSGPWARYMWDNASATGKRVQSMGGIRQVFVVLADADLDLAAAEITAAFTRYAGQRWLGGSTAIVQSTVADGLIDRLAEPLAAVRVGPASDRDTEMGPVVRLERQEGVLRRLEADDVRIRVDGRDLAARPGYFIGPTVAEVDESSGLWLEELQGPVLSLIRADAVEIPGILARAEQGLVGSVFGSEAAIAALGDLPLSMLATNERLGEIEPGTPVAGWEPGFYGSASWNGPDQQRFFTRPRVVLR